MSWYIWRRTYAHKYYNKYLYVFVYTPYCIYNIAVVLIILLLYYVQQFSKNIALFTKNSKLYSIISTRINTSDGLPEQTTSGPSDLGSPTRRCVDFSFGYCRAPCGTGALRGRARTNATVLWAVRPRPAATVVICPRACSTCPRRRAPVEYYN